MSPGSVCPAPIITRQHNFSSTVKEEKNSGAVSVDEYTADFEVNKKTRPLKDLCAKKEGESRWGAEIGRWYLQDSCPRVGVVTVLTFKDSSATELG